MLASSQAEDDPQLVRRLNIFSAAASLFSIATGLSVLLGWVLGNPILKSWLSGQTSVRVNTAVCLVLLGMTLWRSQEKWAGSGWKTSRVASQIAVVIATLAGLLSLLENLFGWDLHIDQLLHIALAGKEVGGTRPDLIPLVASFTLTLLGMSLLALDWKARNQGWAWPRPMEL